MTVLNNYLTSKRLYSFDINGEKAEYVTRLFETGVEEKASFLRNSLFDKFWVISYNGNEDSHR